MNRRCLLSVAVLCTVVHAGCPEPGGHEADAGPDDAGSAEPDYPPVIGDPTAAAELELVFRTVDGQIEKLDENDLVPLILPVQGGKVVYVGIRGRNITSRAQLTAGLFDICADPQILVGVEGRPVLLQDDGSGLAVPVNDPTDIVVSNLANVAMCPAFAASRDTNDNHYRLELRVTEGRRRTEDDPRVHTLTALMIPFCGEAENAEQCGCECDADFVLEVPQEQQCPTIHDNDPLTSDCVE